MKMIIYTKINTDKKNKKKLNSNNMYIITKYFQFFDTIKKILIG